MLNPEKEKHKNILRNKLQASQSDRIQSSATATTTNSNSSSSNTKKVLKKPPANFGGGKVGK